MCHSVSCLSVGLYFGFQGAPARVWSGDKAGSGVGKRLEMERTMGSTEDGGRGKWRLQA